MALLSKTSHAETLNVLVSLEKKHLVHVPQECTRQPYLKHTKTK